nr:DUF2339 domain-containing protein [uncultured Mucilaginibacter sp.]
MEIIYVLFLLIIIILLVTIKNGLQTRTDDLEARILDLQRLIKQTAAAKPPVEVERAKAPEPIRQQPEIKPERPPVIAAPIAPPRRVIDEGVKETRVERPTPAFTPPDYRQPEPELSFFERHPDLEKFIGENLVNKIGIAILVLAIAFFVKYAIDNNWVGPAGRVGIGVLCGSILIGIAHRLRNSYNAFSSVLVGGGIAVLYFTITLAYHQFHLFDQTVSFIILIVITCFAVALALLYDKQELAVIALVGGLSSPFMVSSGHANYSALFIYLVVLNSGLLIIAYNKAWRILNISAFVLTAIITAGVVYSLSASSYSTGLVYCSILYLLFFAINVANNVRENKKFITSDFTILLACNALYFSAGLYLLDAMDKQHLQGLFCAVLGFVNLVLSFLLFRNRKVDNNILYLLIGITLTFISLIAPIQLDGHAITLFWAAEAVLLYWLYQRSQIKLMQLAALLIWLIMAMSLAMDWFTLYLDQFNHFPVIANRGFITTIVAALSSYLLYRLMQNDEDNTIYGFSIPLLLYRNVAFMLLFMAGLLEVNLQFSSRYEGTGLNILYLMLYIPAFVYVFYMLSKKAAGLKLSWQLAMGLLSVCVLIELMFSGAIFQIQADILTGKAIPNSHFIAQWVSALFVALIFYELVNLIRTNLSHLPFAAWITSAAIVLFLSLNVCLAITAMFYTPATTIYELQTVYIKVGLPILWSALSFALMWLGMRYKAQTLRIISLTLFSITLIKLFVFDIRNIPPAGKIAAFFCLGVLLLIVSFMYQKVKKIIADDGDAHNEI